VGARIRGVVMCVVAFGAALSACHANADDPAGHIRSTEHTTFGDPLRITTHPLGPVVDLAGLTGRLALSKDRCLYLSTRVRGKVYRSNILWPAGYSADELPDGTVTLFNAKREPVAHLGTQVTLTGGDPNSPHPRVACSVPRASYFRVDVDDLPALPN
jgi:hypothetical protein